MDSFRNKNSEDIAVEIKGSRYTFGDIYNKSEEISSLLGNRFSPGECIIIGSVDIFVFISCLFSLHKKKLKFCCWNEKSDFEKLSNLVAATGYIESSSNDKLAFHRLEKDNVKVDQLGDFIISTSGSTGSPKGVLLKLDNIVSNAKKAGLLIELNNYNLDKWCIDTDLSLMSAISHLFMAWASSLPLTILKGFSQNEISNLFSSSKVGFGGAPLQLTNLASKLNIICNGSLLVSSGDFLTKENIDSMIKRHNKVSICTFYGLTELSGRLCYMNAEDIRKYPGAAGKPIIENSISLNENSEIITVSPLLFEGYYREGKSFEENINPFNTGDTASIDENGYYWLEGRNSDTFKVSGLKVNRLKIEREISEIMKGLKYCILPVKHNIMGTCCALFIKNDASVEPPSIKKIISKLKEKSPTSYIPVYIYLLDSFPSLGNGKLNKQLLIENHKTFKRHR